MSRSKIAENNSACKLPISAKPYAIARGVKVYIIPVQTLGWCVVLEHAGRVRLYVNRPSRLEALSCAAGYQAKREGVQLTLWVNPEEVQEVAA